ncbi:archaeal proteasome endopeptidase complex subunit alpha [Candidatus Woesearchaeota archaeon]|nr:archaeal proteasome endopeptidase complex subunit alpha [Candidatus Woesearchaeota archaeon]
MQPLQHQMMGYDRAITMFSPDGRLLQVEYAKKTVRLGNTAIGMVCADGVLLVTDKRIIDKLVVPEAIEKVFQVDDHVMATAAGIISDARVLIERSQVKAQQHKVTYNAPIDVLSVVKDVCNLKQLTTQSGGFRPFGVSLLIAGKDEEGLKLFETDPTGIFYQYKATAIGEGEQDVEEVLHKEYKDAMTIDDGLKLAVKALKKVLNDGFNAERIEAAVIRDKDGKMEKLGKARIAKYLK